MSTLQLSSLVRAWWRAHEALGMSVQLKDDPQVSFSDRQRRVSCGARKVDIALGDDGGATASVAHTAAASLAELLRLLAVAARAGPTVFGVVAAGDGTSSASACRYRHCVWCDDADNSGVYVELTLRDARVDQPLMFHNMFGGWNEASSSDEYKALRAALETMAANEPRTKGPQLGVALRLDPSAVGGSAFAQFVRYTEEFLDGLSSLESQFIGLVVRMIRLRLSFMALLDAPHHPRDIQRCTKEELPFLLSEASLPANDEAMTPLRALKTLLYVELSVRNAGEYLPQIFYDALYAWDASSATEDFTALHEALETIETRTAWKEGPQFGVTLELFPMRYWGSRFVESTPAEQRPLVINPMALFDKLRCGKESPVSFDYLTELRMTLNLFHLPTGGAVKVPYIDDLPRAPLQILNVRWIAPLNGLRANMLQIILRHCGETLQSLCLDTMEYNKDPYGSDIAEIIFSTCPQLRFGLSSLADQI
ncbi:hypothetical protein ATCC90586_004046 [Pythium insidiosum]|nr:hypothetical protein ATCC90586_004046 [Pythium insidiosum]